MYVIVQWTTVPTVSDRHSCYCEKTSHDKRENLSLLMVEKETKLFLHMTNIIQLKILNWPIYSPKVCKIRRLAFSVGFVKASTTTVQ